MNVTVLYSLAVGLKNSTNRILILSALNAPPAKITRDDTISVEPWMIETRREWRGLQTSPAPNRSS